MITEAKFLIANMDLNYFMNKYKLYPLAFRREFNENYIELLIDGNHCNSENDLYEHFSEKLHFPYFGNNWDALLDSISDLSWFINLKFNIYILNIQEFMKEDAIGRNIFFEIILKNIHERWSSPMCNVEEDEKATLNFIINSNNDNELFIKEMFEYYAIKPIILSQ
jgi:RNAse (barnase) inhibitor barstar